MVFMALHGRDNAALTDHFPDPFVQETLRGSSTLLWRNNVQKFDADAILYGETRC